LQINEAKKSFGINKTMLQMKKNEAKM